MIRTVPGSEKYFNSRLTLPSRIIRAGFRIADNYMNLSAYGPFNITLSREKRFLWFRVPKAATTSTMLFLRKTGEQLDAEYAKNSYYLPALYQSWFKFSFVRNPWSRLVSAWQNKVVNTNLFDFPPGERERMLQFEYFVQKFVASQDLATCDSHLRMQTRLIPIQDMDFIGRQENYNQDIAFVVNHLNLPNVPIPKINVTAARSKYTAYYSPALKNLVGDWYADDVKNFNYDGGQVWFCARQFTTIWSNWVFIPSCKEGVVGYCIVETIRSYATSILLRAINYGTAKSCTYNTI